VEATAPRELIAMGDKMPITVSVYNRGQTPILISDVGFEGWDSTGLAQPRFDTSHPLPPDSIARSSRTFYAHVTEPTMSWWLRQPLHGDMFTQPLAPMITGEDRLPEIGPEVALQIGGTELLAHAAPIVNRRSDAVVGEIRRPIAFVPEITVLLDHEVEYARAN